MDSVSRQLLLSAAGATPPPTAPLSIWTMESISGNTVPDSVGSLPGTKTSAASVVTGYSGNALRFAASTDYINMGNRKSAYDTAVSSIAMRVKFNTLADSYLISNHARGGGSGSIYNNGWTATVTPAGKLRATNTVLNNEAWTDGGTGGGSGTDYTPRVSTPDGALTTGVYYLITVVSGLTYITLYLNDVKIGTTTHSQNKRTGFGDASINGHYCLGNYLYDNGTNLNRAVYADIDETRHYNYALTDANVAWLNANM